MKWKPTEAQRAYFYRVALTLLGLLAIYGLIRKEDIPAWLEFIGALLGVGSSGLAAKHTSTKPK